jgi:23S rRNA (pseudouridine1915-N3)-methyltransferase
MKLSFFHVSRERAELYQEATAFYLKRLQPYATIDVQSFSTEAALFAGFERLRGRVAPLLVLLDSRGKTYSSEDFAAWLERERDAGRQAIVLAIGAASGWSDAARAKADLLLSLGPMTLPHELARVVLTEQVYRAFTIMAGHPYHLGH